MSVILDMPMPKTCEQCRLYDSVNYDGRYCLAKYKETHANALVERDIDCPIVCELPKGHGRLIDSDRVADKLEALRDEINCFGNAYESGIRKGYDYSLDELVNEPTIIEANKKESEE